jgi:hypothetical protein
MKLTARTMLCVSFALLMVTPGFAISRQNAAGEEGIVPVSSGSSVTVWEQSGEIKSYTFSIDAITSPNEGSFWTWGHEDYYISTDGVYLTIKCNRYWTPYPDPHPWMSVGNNIVAVRLDGGAGYPDGLWAGIVVDYQLGEYGTADSVYNALGSVDQLGPFENAQPTWLGDSWSRMTLGFGSTPQPIARFTIWPSTNLGIYQYILFDASTSTDQADPTSLVYRWDWEGDGIWDTDFTAEKTALHWYTNEGTYASRLEVRNAMGLTDLAEVEIVIHQYQYMVGILIEKSPGYPAGPVWLGMMPRHSGDITFTLWHSDVTSVVLELYDITMDSEKVMRMTVKFKQQGTYPSGTIVCDPIMAEADHYYRLIIKDLDAPIGASFMAIPFLTW